MLSFNINENVKVKLTEHGRKAWDDYWSVLDQYGAPRPPIETRIDADGFARFQMHELMRIFSQAMMSIASTKMPFEQNALYFDEADFQK